MFCEVEVYCSCDLYVTNLCIFGATRDGGTVGLQAVVCAWGVSAGAFYYRMISSSPKPLENVHRIFVEGSCEKMHKYTNTISGRSCHVVITYGTFELTYCAA